MDLTGIGSVADLLKDGLDKIFPDKTQAEQAKAALAMAEEQGRLQDLQNQWDNFKAQIGVNQAEAGSSNMFVAGWRPFVGWTCGTSFAYQFVIEPIASFIFAAAGHPVTLPPLDFSAMSTVLMGMLGLGAMRSFDKAKGTTDGH